MILRILGLGILFFVLLFTLPFMFFFFWPFGWMFGNFAWLVFLLFIGFGIYLLARNRRTGQLAFGVLLLFAGAAFLSYNLWDFDLLRFWPLILIFWGLMLVAEKSILNKNERRPAQ